MGCATIFCKQRSNATLLDSTKSSWNRPFRFETTLIVRSCIVIKPKEAYLMRVSQELAVQ